jgi:hypothetical protein
MVAVGAAADSVTVKPTEPPAVTVFVEAVNPVMVRLEDAGFTVMV